MATKEKQSMTVPLHQVKHCDELSVMAALDTIMYHSSDRLTVEEEDRIARWFCSKYSVVETQ